MRGKKVKRRTDSRTTVEDGYEAANGGSADVQNPFMERRSMSELSIRNPLAQPLPRALCRTSRIRAPVSGRRTPVALSVGHSIFFAIHLSYGRAAGLDLLYLFTCIPRTWD